MDRNPPRGPVSVGAEVERDLGALVPSIAVHAAAPAMMAAAWTMLRAVVIEPGLVDRTTKEAVAAAVAYGNGCRGCEELHLTALESLNRRRVDCELSTLADQRVRRVAEWARSAGLRETGERRPFADHQVPELVGTVVVSHYLNRMAMVLSDGSFADRISVRAPGPGAEWLPAGELPADMGWALGRPPVAEAFGRAARVLGRGVPDSVRAVVSGRLAGWRGEVPEGDSWSGGALDGLADGEVAVGRLALSTAIAPRSVDAVLVDVVRQRWGARVLVEVAGWAAFAAARRIGGWLGAGVGSGSHGEAKVIPFRRPIGQRRSPLSGTEQRQAEI